ncbi:hypothetical protein MTY66_47920 [Mycolicibacterium sp. TY66]|uniref:hypothetical protein n=1 Tax=Mycobacteriaceae TaxID=1762 RepID=UPI001BB40DD9|nr:MULTISPECIES: hypothetical protein [unclassified Mycolicibacterium]BCI83167.1 hypothetical protein MTY66_47920 [Mycolicibacterium sp. TY66]BCJ79187.1 hypothetical protein MTY81_05600 [Mycolicibacterium sp. TY81]
MGILNVFDPQPSEGARDAGPLTPLVPPAPTYGTPAEKAWQRAKYVREQHGKHLASVVDWEKREEAKRPVTAMTDAQRELHTQIDTALRRTFEETGAAKDLESSAAEMSDQLTQAQDRVRQVRERMTTAGDDTASELRNGRAWDRVVRTLDAKPEGALVAAATDVLMKAKVSELPVLADEIPPYLASRGAPTEFVDDVLARRDPEYAAAVCDARLAAKQKAVADWNTAKLRKEIQGGYQSEVPLVDPTKVTAQVYRG